MTDYTLSHPVYLDIPMMLSFLAALEGGVVVSQDMTETSSETSSHKASATAGLRARLFTVGSGELGAAGSLDKSATTGATSQVQRQHTAESLFNALLATLREDSQITSIESSEELRDLAIGQIVEIEGTFRGNPLEDILAFFATILPYVEPEPPSKANPKSGNPAQRAAAQKADSGPALDPDITRMFHLMNKDLENSPVHDLLFRTPSGLPVVATASTEFYGPATVEYLREGSFRVLGKVTKVVGDGETINLSRRTVLGLASSDIAEDIVSSARAIEGVNLDVAEAIVPTPALQILPLAIYI